MSENSNNGASSSAPVESAPSSGDQNLASDQNLVVSEGSEHESVEAIDADVSLSKEEKKEAKKRLKQLEIKYNGKTEKVDLPFEIDEEHAEYMRTKLQKEKLATQKAQEYAALERDIMAFFQELKKDPRKALSNPAYGVDLKKIAADMIEEELANAQKTPEQLELEQLKREKAERDEELKRQKEEYEAYQKQQEIEKIANQWDKEMAKALETYKIPSEPYAVKKMAEYMAAEIKKGFAPDMQNIAQKVEAELSGDYKKILAKMSIEEKIKFLGEDIFEEARKHRVSQIKKSPVAPKAAAKDVAKKEEKKAEPAKKTNYKDFFGI
jgi:hypothetical protein